MGDSEMVSRARLGACLALAFLALATGTKIVDLGSNGKAPPVDFGEQAATGRRGGGAPLSSFSMMGATSNRAGNSEDETTQLGELLGAGRRGGGAGFTMGSFTLVGSNRAGNSEDQNLLGEASQVHDESEMINGQHWAETC